MSKNIEVQVTTVPERNHALLLWCSVCGPVAVDTTGINNMVLGKRHLSDVHHVRAVPA
jgi:hypothetical protein